jgi:poly(A) polymerase
MNRTEGCVLVEQVLLSDSPKEHLEALSRSGALRDLFPEVTAMVGFGGEEHGHKDLWEHTKQVVSQSACEPVVRWAALFHDVGKVRTIACAAGRVTFHGHESVGARLFDVAARRAGMDSALRERVRFLIRHLGYVEGYDTDWTDSAVRRLHKELGDHFDDVLKLARADITTRHDHKRKAHHARMDQLEARAKAIAAADAKPASLPKGLGRLMMAELGVPPGPELGDLMRALADAVEAGGLPRRAEPGIYVAHAREHLLDPSRAPERTPDCCNPVALVQGSTPTEVPCSDCP